MEETSEILKNTIASYNARFPFRFGKQEDPLSHESYEEHCTNPLFRIFIGGHLCFNPNSEVRNRIWKLERFHESELSDGYEYIAQNCIDPTIAAEALKLSKI